MASERSPRFPLEPTSQPPGPLNVPHGKQEWYVHVGGIWRDVTLSRVPATRVGAVRVLTALHGTVSVQISRVGLETADTAQIRVLHNGSIQATGEASFTDSVARMDLHVESPAWWSPESPVLYTLQVTVGGGTQTIRFGFRTIETRGGRLLLNGEPPYLVGALDQDFYRETIYTPPSEEFLRDQFRKAKELGLNCLRCHIKVPDQRYLDLAVEMGMLMWAEIPS